MNKILLVVFTVFIGFVARSQTGTEFWFAAPEVTSGHGDSPIFIRVSSGASPADVTISMPANGGFTDINISLLANSSFSQDMTAFKDEIETAPEDSILSTGILITSTANISAYYEVNRSNNPDIFALKGTSALGMEFYTPFQTLFNNWNYTPAAYASFDIVATEDNTLVRIYPRKDLVGHPSFAQFTVTLNRGETYSSRSVGITGPEKPAGSVIVSDKPIAVTIKDDSNRKNSGGSCRDLLGDQIVPVEIIGKEYIVTQGGLTTEESYFILATENNTDISINGVYNTTLFAGETSLQYVTQAHTFIQASKPVYLIHISGFGCEMGMALLPPLNCAGSEQVFFTRSTTEFFGLNLLVKSGAEDGFVLNGDSTLIQASDFVDVPGTAGIWKAAQLDFSTTEIPLNASNLITNSKDVFGMGIIHGGATTGCRFGYFSEFKAPIQVDAGLDLLVCNGNKIQLSGDVSGGVNTGIWNTNGSGSFDLDTEFNTIYNPTASDYAIGGLQFRLTSTGICPSKTDTMDMNFTVAPTTDAGSNQDVCVNNTDISLNGSVLIAPGAFWSGGSGVFLPDTTALTATYQPTTTEVSSGSMYLFLTSLPHQDCKAFKDSILIDFTAAPIVDAGANVITCENNPDANLNGSVISSTGSSAGTWSNGAGFVTPSNNALTGIYSPTPTEVNAGVVNLVLGSNAGDNCNFEYDTTEISIVASPTANAGVDQVTCVNNSTVQLNGSVTQSSGGTWLGGIGTFSPNRNDLNATYQPDPSEIAFGSLILRLQTTGEVANCLSVEDDIQISFTTAPTVDAGASQTICENNSVLNLSGSVLTAPGGYWNGGNGVFLPDTTSLNATYQPTDLEISSGSIYLYLTSLDYQNCLPVVDSFLVAFTSAPIVNAGVDIITCENNPDANLNGSVVSSSGSSAGTWSNGAGFITPSNSALTGIYSPTPTEINTGFVNLVLSSNEGDDCKFEYDTTRISIVALPTANAGVDQVICVNNSTVQLNGSVTQATGGRWLGGIGIFSPNRNDLNATYQPDPSEIAFGSLILKLETTGEVANCLSVEDDIQITFTAGPTVDAGNSKIVCENNSILNLSGSVLTAPGGYWNGGNGVFLPDTTSLNATYQPTDLEISSGSMYVYLTSLDYQDCLPVVDSFLVNFTSAPIVDAGLDITVCANNSDANLNGSVVSSSGSSAGIWSNGSGFITPSNNALTGVYSPTPTEITNEVINLILSSNEGDNCNFERDTVKITVLPSPVADASVDQVICANNPDVTLNGATQQATGGTWLGGIGTFSPNRNVLNATYTPTPSEISLGSVNLKLRTTGIASSCNFEEDDLQISFTPAPTVDAGSNVSVCGNNENVDLNGTISLASGATWSNYNGTFVIGDDETLNSTYSPSTQEISNGRAVLFLTTLPYLNCNNETDSIVITITPASTVSAGPNQTSCANNASTQLLGSFANASGVQWSGGSGSFVPSINAPSTTYIPSPSEITDGSITLYLSTFDDVNNCLIERDSMQIVISQSPSANAGPDQVLCANNATAQLSGSVALAAGGRWSGGTGTFSPHDSVFNARYTPTASEINSGNLTLTYTSTGNGACNAESDDMSIIFTPAPTSDAGLDQNVCRNNATTQLDGNISIATGSVWTGGSGVFVPDAFDADAVYNPTQAELNTGNVTLTLRTTGNGSCVQETDQVTINFTPEPIVSAGNDQFICVTNLTAPLNGEISGATTTGTWSTPDGTGVFFPNQNDLEATYVVSSQDSSNGSVTLLLTSTNNGNCLAVSESINVTVTTPGESDAGPNQVVCSNNASVNLSGSVTGGASGGIWNTDGTGIFSPNASDLSAVYIPSGQDTANRIVVLTLVANSCDQDADDMVVTITDGPRVDAGVNQLKCIDSPEVQLSGIVGGASSTGEWISSGTGSFDPNNTDLNAIYNPSASDLANKNVLIILNATNIGTCTPTRDTIAVRISDIGTVNVGTNQSVCTNDPIISVSAQLNGGASSGRWETNGSGSFLPSPNATNITYNPSSADLSSGSVMLKFESNSCDKASDSLIVSYTPSPSANAGLDQSICANNANIPLLGNFAVSSGAEWSTDGSGTFDPSTSAMNTVYIPSLDDLNQDLLYIRLTTTGNGNCNPEVDSIRVDISPSPIVDAGKNQSICFTNLVASLNGMVSSSSSTGRWRTLGSGSFVPNDSTLNAQYELSSADSSNGSVTLILTSTNNDICIAEDDSITISVGGKAFVDAGTDELVCKETPNAQLSGIVSGGSSKGKWTTLGDGAFIPNDSSLSATYSFGTVDSQQGSVSLLLTSNAEAGCESNIDTVAVTLAPVTIVDAGNNQTLCETVDTVILNANIINGTTGKWSTLGNGFFSPSDAVFSPTYHFGPQDKIQKTVNLVFGSQGNYECATQYDTVMIVLTNPVIADFLFTGKCKDETIVFKDTSTTSLGVINSWSWDFGNGDNSGSQNSETSYDEIGNYDVTLTVGSSTGCTNAVTKNVTINEIPTADFELLTVTPKTFDPIEFEDKSLNAVVWRWTFGTNDTLFLQNPVYTYEVAGTYNIQLYVESAVGCNDSTALITSALGEEIVPPKVPTAFTPNNDGNNDVYYVRGGPFSEIEFLIYNQWGEIVFETTNPDEGWNGMHKGKKQPMGVYLYTIKATTVDGIAYQKSGEVNLIE